MSEVKGSDLVPALMQKRLAGEGSPAMRSIQGGGALAGAGSAVEPVAISGAKRRMEVDASRKVRAKRNQKSRASCGAMPQAGRRTCSGRRGWAFLSACVRKALMPRTNWYTIR